MDRTAESDQNRFKIVRDGIGPTAIPFHLFGSSMNRRGRLYRSTNKFLFQKSLLPIGMGFHSWPISFFFLSLFISADLPAASRVAFQLNFPLSVLSIDKVKNLVDPPCL